MISDNVVIMTLDELDAIKDKWFQMGVKRGKFEQESIITRQDLKHGDKVIVNCPGFFAHGKVGKCIEFNNNEWKVQIFEYGNNNIYWFLESELKVCQ